MNYDCFQSKDSILVGANYIAPINSKRFMGNPWTSNEGQYQDWPPHYDWPHQIDQQIVRAQDELKMPVREVSRPTASEVLELQDLRRAANEWRKTVETRDQINTQQRIIISHLVVLGNRLRTLILQERMYRADDPIMQT